MVKTKKSKGEVFSPAKRRGHLTPGRALKIVRELQEMTQNELASKSGVDQSVISALEHGRVQLGVERAKKLARALRVHPAVLVFADWTRGKDSASHDHWIEEEVAKKHAASA
jgi:transcriptional regulator with XRE-family HTH domain